MYVLYVCVYCDTPDVGCRFCVCMFALAAWRLANQLRRHPTLGGGLPRAHRLQGALQNAQATLLNAIAAVTSRRERGWQQTMTETVQRRVKPQPICTVFPSILYL